jgi:phage-related protein
MKSSLFIVFLLVGVSHSLFGPIGQTINNLGNSINSGANGIGSSIGSATNQIGSSVQLVENFLTDLRGHVDKVIRELLSSVNQLQSAATFLWDNVFSPAFDMLTKGTNSFYLIPNAHRLFSNRCTNIS